MDKAPDVLMSALQQLQRTVDEQAKRFDYTGSESVSVAFSTVADLVGDVLDQATAGTGATLEHPRAGISIDPSVLNGEPCLTGRRLPARLVADVAGEFGVDEAEHMWSLTRSEVLVACWFAAGRHADWQEWARTFAAQFAGSEWDAIPDPPTPVRG